MEIIEIHSKQNSFKNKPVIYGLLDPNLNIIRYIGKSLNGIDRAFEHTKPSGLKVDGNTRKANWLRSLLKQNLTPKVCILATLPFNKDKEALDQDLYSLEHDYIDAYKSEWLTNAQDGGKGSLNRKASKQTRKKMSENTKNFIKIHGLHPTLQANTISKYPDNIIQNNQILRYCRICAEFKPIPKIGHRTRVCNKCKLILYPYPKSGKNSLAVQIARWKKRHRVTCFDINKQPIMSFVGLREAAKFIGSKCSKTGITSAIERNSFYYGYFWEKICQSL